MSTYETDKAVMDGSPKPGFPNPRAMEQYQSLACRNRPHNRK